ncbi:MAG: hypothetical protein K2O23_04315 [Anaeroplasmataceae bacterium]|nr:hypothetical protein [Anaeroplasmataceae bacterium]
MFNFFKKKQKEVLDCLGYYDIKPYHYFESNMTYAKDILVLKNDFVKVYTRLYKDTIFVFTFVDDETGFNKEQYSYDALKDKIDAVITDAHKSVVSLIVFKNNNEETVSIAKQMVVNTKKEFNQTFIYDAEKVRLKYYRPVPSFYSLYNHYAEALMFDFGVMELEKE